MLAPLKASGGTIHGAAVQALHRDGVRVPAGAKLIVIVVGDEAGETGAQLAHDVPHARLPRRRRWRCSCSGARRAARRCATARASSRVPYSEVDVAQFDDPYHVPRVLRALLEAPVSGAASPTPGLVEKVMATKLLELV